MTEQVVDTIEDSQKADIRAILYMLIAEMDILQMFGLSRSFIKKQVTKYRKLLSNPVGCTGKGTKKEKWFPTVGEMHSMFHTGHLVSEMIHFLKTPKEHGWKVEAAQVLRNKLTYIDRYGKPKRKHHPDYGPSLGRDLNGNWEAWIDKYGYNVRESQHKLAQVFRERFKREKGRDIYKHEVRNSDPTEEVK